MADKSRDERIDYIVGAIDDIIRLSQAIAVAPGGTAEYHRQLGVAARKITREIFGNDNWAKGQLQRMLDKHAGTAEDEEPRGNE